MIEPAANDAAKPVFHGGGLDEAIARHGGARAEWIDLSTGINPVAPPLPVILPDDHARLPGRSL
jgi:cobalamin biosynthetic protein CobC